MSQKRATLSVPALARPANDQKNLTLAASQKAGYPLYEYASRDNSYFSKELYDSNNETFQFHKMVEQRLFENRQKIVQL